MWTGKALGLFGPAVAGVSFPTLKPVPIRISRMQRALCKVRRYSHYGVRYSETKGRGQFSSGIIILAIAAWCCLLLWSARPKQTRSGMTQSAQRACREVRDAGLVTLTGASGW